MHDCLCSGMMEGNECLCPDVRGAYMSLSIMDGCIGGCSIKAGAALTGSVVLASGIGQKVEGVASFPHLQ